MEEVTLRTAKEEHEAGGKQTGSVADEAVGRSIAGRLAVHLSQAEVAELDFAVLVDEDVVRLEVAVDDGRVQSVQLNHGGDQHQSQLPGADDAVVGRGNPVLEVAAYREARPQPIPARERKEGQKKEKRKD
jgi:hypothetical protein